MVKGKEGDNQRNIVLTVLGALFLFAVFSTFNGDLSGNASRSVSYNLQLEEDQYLLNVGNFVFVDGKKITLITVADGNEVIVSVSGIQKSVSQYTNRVINDVQIQNLPTSRNSALLKIISLNTDKISCGDSDQGNIYAKGRCTDRFYEDKPVEDFCDFNTLVEYSCGYDTFIDEVHCLKHTVKCADGCNLGACVTR